jgi:hypothetical protein
MFRGTLVQTFQRKIINTKSKTHLVTHKNVSEEILKAGGISPTVLSTILNREYRVNYCISTILNRDYRVKVHKHEIILIFFLPQSNPYVPFVNFRKKFRFFSFDFRQNFDVRTFPR